MYRDDRGGGGTQSAGTHTDAAGFLNLVLIQHQVETIPEPFSQPQRLSRSAHAFFQNQKRYIFPGMVGTMTVSYTHLSEELVNYILSEFEEEPDKIWSSNLFGKPLNELMGEGLQSKLGRIPDEERIKLQETLQRIINEGSSGLICIIL